MSRVRGCQQTGYFALVRQRPVRTFGRQSVSKDVVVVKEVIAEISASRLLQNYRIC